MLDDALFHPVLRNQSVTPSNGLGVKINRIVMFDTGTYNHQYRRAYDTQLTAESLQNIRGRLKNSSRYTASMLGGAAASFVQPNSSPESMLNIDNGWGERRLQFMMEVEYTHRTGGTTKEILTGYTTHVGITLDPLNPSFDPQMEFIINGIIPIKTTTIRGPMGTEQRISTGEACHLLVNNGYRTVYNQNQETRLRPADMFAIISRNHVDLGDGVFDTRSNATSQPVRSRRTNGNPANYVADILETYKNTLGSQQGVSDLQTTMMDARGFSEETPAGEDVFLSLLRQSRGDDFVTDRFVWNDLVKLSDTVSHVTQVVLATPMERAKLHQVGQTCDWAATDRMTQVASILSQSIPAIMLEYGVIKMAANMTNTLIGSQHNIIFGNIQSFSNINMAPYAEPIKQRLIGQVLRDISYDGGIGYDIEISMDIMGESMLSIRLDSEQGIYVIPSFADGLMAPMLTADTNRAINMSSDFETLMNHVIDTDNIVTDFTNGAGYEPSTPMFTM